MRKWAFILFIVGMFVLFVFLMRGAREIESFEGLEINEKVLVSGLVVEERVLYEGTKLFELENGMELVCECNEQLEGKEIEAEGVVSEYEGKKQLTVLRIWE